MRISDWSSGVCSSDLIGPFKAVRIGRVEAGDALDRRLEVIVAALLHQRGKFGAKARRARRFVNDQAAAGLPDRRLDRLDVERQQGAQIEDLDRKSAVYVTRE